MLVLSRQINESIIIGDDIEITMVDIKAGKVRIGISAPQHVSVHRKEVYLEIKAQNIAAAASQADDRQMEDLFLKQLNKKPENI